MKSRPLAVATALLLSIVLAVPSFAFAQDTTQSQPPSAPPATNTQDQTQPASDPSAIPTAPANSTSTPSTTADAPKATHDKGKNDIDDIGNRKLGSGSGKGIGDWYGYDTEIKMGKQYAMMVESSARMIQDPVIVEYVNRIGQNLVRNSDAKVPFTIKVLDDDSVNAFALPGGFFYVNTGLILAADNEAELAGVMSHEIAHVAACHAARENTRGQLASLATIPLIFVGGGIGLAAQEAAGLALPIGFLKFSRTFESEADYLGLQYMYKSGYDPQAFTAFFEKIETLEKKKIGYMTRIRYVDHPQTPDRIAKSQREIATILPPRNEYIVDTSEFQQAKKRLALIMKHRLPKDNKEETPQLRRTADQKDPQKDDDRPVIKRKLAN